MPREPRGKKRKAQEGGPRAGDAEAPVGWKEGLMERLHDLEVHLRQGGQESLEPEEQLAVRRVMKPLHELLVPSSRQSRRPQHITITEGQVDASMATLRPDATCLFSCQEVVDVIASFLNHNRGVRGARLSRSGAPMRALNRATCLAYSTTVRGVRYNVNKDAPGQHCNFFRSFPNVDSVTLNGLGKGAARSIDAVFSALADIPGMQMRYLQVDGQTIGKQSIKLLVDLAVGDGPFSTLEYLSFNWARIDNPAMAPLVAAWKKGRGTFLPRLRSLSLFNNDKLGDTALMELLEAWEVGMAPGLEVLDVRLCGMTERSLLRLVDVFARGAFPSLRTLAIGADVDDLWRHNRADGRLIVELAGAIQSGAGRTLEKLHLDRFPVSTEGVKALVRCKQEGCLPNIQVLSLTPGHIMDKEASTPKLEGAFGEALSLTDGKRSWWNIARDI